MRTPNLLVELLPAAAIALLFIPGVRSGPRALEPASGAATTLQDAAQDAQPSQGMPDLVGGLKNTPGCLGVETGQMASGKRSIFA